MYVWVLSNNKSPATVSHGVNTSHTSSLPAVRGRRSANDDLMRPQLISISQLAGCSAWLKTLEGIADFPSDYQAWKLSGREHRQEEMHMKPVWWGFPPQLHNGHVFSLIIHFFNQSSLMHRSSYRVYIIFQRILRHLQAAMHVFSMRLSENIVHAGWDLGS